MKDNEDDRPKSDWSCSIDSRFPDSYYLKQKKKATKNKLINETRSYCSEEIIPSNYITNILRRRADVFKKVESVLV
jgi:hypothetical protein